MYLYVHYGIQVPFLLRHPALNLRSKWTVPSFFDVDSDACSGSLVATKLNRSIGVVLMYRLIRDGDVSDAVSFNVLQVKVRELFAYRLQSPSKD